MPVVGPGLGERHAALNAQSRAVLLAERRQGQREDERIVQDRLEIEQVSLQRVPFRIGRAVVCGIGEQFLGPDLHRLADRFQAPRALPGDLGPGRGRDQHPLRHRLHAHVKLDVAALGHASKTGLHVRGSRDGALLRVLRSGAAAEVEDAEDQGLARIESR